MCKIHQLSQTCWRGTCDGGDVNKIEASCCEPEGFGQDVIVKSPMCVGKWEENEVSL